ncbi:hypothetical protein CDL12_25934 [Handroanthus impetiginosus]|uniref:Uncharacterized protein n=1 Tax=Handroanthus impetiginosus TaxID=429701 RepID=A0A2G9G8D7_9LAMI|nr:hypothetical protein CDL12_25934 [Handroanthus impetiginosus]
MEAAVKVALPSERLMGSTEGFGSGGSSGGVVVGEVRWHTEGACSSGGKKDDARAVNVSAPAFWRKIPDSEVCVEVCQPSSLHSCDAANDRGLGSISSHPSTLDLDAKAVLQKSGKVVRNNSGSTKKSGMVQMEVSKSKPGLRDVNGISLELASSSASCNISEKNQLVKQKNNSASRRGDKRNCKVKHKSRCESFSLRNGLVGFNSAAGGNNYFGIYGLKPDVFDITKYVNEPSLDELLHGSDSCPCVAKDKGKKAANSNNNLLQSVRKACSVIQAQKVLQSQNCAEIDNCIQKVSSGLVTVSSAGGHTDGEKRDGCTADLPSPDKVQESDDKIKMSNVVDSPLCEPKDVLERLALPPPKDLDLLLSDASRSTFSSKNNTDPRLGKQVSHRSGLPPFPWSHSFSGHKLGSDAVKLSTSRTICQGRWVKVQNSVALQKGSADLLVNFESLTFDECLVPPLNLASEHPQNELAQSERVLSAFGACAISKVPTDSVKPDEHSPSHVAAQTLLDMAASLMENPSATVKLLKKPPQAAIKTSKLKAIERPDKLFDASKSTTRPINPSKVGDDGFPSKKLRVSADVTNTYVNHTEPVRKRMLHWSTPVSVKTPPKKLFRDSSTSTDNYGMNIVKKPFIMKPPRGTDKSSSNQLKFSRSSQ